MGFSCLGGRGRKGESGTAVARLQSALASTALGQSLEALHSSLGGLQRTGGASTHHPASASTGSP